MSNTGSGCVIHYAFNDTGTQWYISAINNASSFQPYQLSSCFGLALTLG
jgi:hypothetical protein